jgi:phosphoenolpyruvate carboxylase
VNLDSVEWGFRQIDQDIRWLSDSLVEVLSTLGEGELARWVPWASQADPALSTEVEPPARLGLALAMAFQLLNTVEERVSETLRDRREESGSPEAERGLWADQLVELVRAGATSESILEALRSVEVEPVFTAHPTEAKRASVLEQHRMLMQLLQSASQSGARRAHRIELTVLLERLWRTGEILIEKPTVADERRNVRN